MLFHPHCWIILFSYTGPVWQLFSLGTLRIPGSSPPSVCCCYWVVDRLFHYYSLEKYLSFLVAVKNFALSWMFFHFVKICLSVEPLCFTEPFQQCLCRHSEILLLSSIRKILSFFSFSKVCFKLCLTVFLQNPLLSTSRTYILKLFSQSSPMCLKLL